MNNEAGWLGAARKALGQPEFTQGEKNMLRGILIQLGKARANPNQPQKIKIQIPEDDGTISNVIMTLEVEKKRFESDSVTVMSASVDEDSYASLELKVDDFTNRVALLTVATAVDPRGAAYDCPRSTPGPAHGQEWRNRDDGRIYLNPRLGGSRGRIDDRDSRAH